MMEQVELLKKNGDAAGLVQYFLDLNAEKGSPKRRAETLQVKAAAAKAVAEMGTPQALDALLNALDTASANQAQAYMLADAAATTGSPKAVQELMRMAGKHESPKVRHAATFGLAEHMDGFGDRRDDVFDFLSSALDDPEWLVRYAVAFKLRAEDPRTVDLLIRALGDSDERVREQAANGLRFQFGKEPGVQEALLGLVSDPSERIRRIAAGEAATSGAKLPAQVPAAKGQAVGPQLDTPAIVWIGVLLLAALVPAAYLGGEAAKGLSRASGGPIGGVVALGIGGIVLGILGAGAYGVATKWRSSLPAVAGGGVVALAGLSLWMLVSVREAGENVLVFLISAVVLAVAAVFIKLFGSQ